MNRIFRLLAKLLLGLALLLLVTFLFLWIRNLHFIEGTDKQNVAYLSQNKQDINLQLSGAGSDAALFDSVFYESQVFLLGENHGYLDVQLLDRQLLLHLNKKAGLRWTASGLKCLMPFSQKMQGIASVKTGRKSYQASYFAAVQ